MPYAVRVAAAVTAVVAVLDWRAVVRGDLRTERWAKPAVVVGLAVVALLAGAGGSTTGRWVLLALALGLVGDVLLLPGPDRFVAGLVAFLLGHLAWVAACVGAGLALPALGWVGVGVLIVALVAGRGILPAAHRHGGAPLAGAVAAYMLVIGAMAVVGWATGLLLVGLGATLFVVSDTVLATGRFVAEHRWTRPVVMVTYHLAQALLVAGLLS
ncbi:MAG TPA: lysoplasmalogenase [Ornithinibacter sp.]|nr:lysoplasmalogenase [Ornithinibacter sp.]